jgi:hypothetical protein
MNLVGIAPRKPCWKHMPVWVEPVRDLAKNRAVNWSLSVFFAIIRSNRSSRVFASSAAPVESFDFLGESARLRTGKPRRTSAVRLVCVERVHTIICNAPVFHGVGERPNFMKFAPAMSASMHPRPPYRS